MSHKLANETSIYISTGNLHQVFNRDGWKFHHDIVQRYGSVVKLRWLFGVCVVFL